MGVKDRVIGLGLGVFGATQAHRLLAPFTRGPGAILMLHRVTDEAPATPGYDPNRGLSVTPAHLDATLALAARLGFEFVTMDEATARLQAGLDPKHPFIVVSFDDGYRDNLTNALPVLRKHSAPFTLYVTPGFADGTARLWWIELEEAIRRLDHVEMAFGGARYSLPARTPQEKTAAFMAVYWPLRALDEAAMLDAIAGLAAKAGADPGAFAPALCMGWNEIATIAADPLCTIGAHTMTHPRLAKIPADAARAEMAESRRVIAQRLGRDPVHFAYPVGDPTSAGEREFALAVELGFQTAVTTRPGMLFASDRDNLLRLPRVSVSGNWQRVDFVDILLSGAPFALWNGVKRLRAA